MVTVTMGYEVAVTPAAAPWWRRRDAYVLAPLAIVHALLAGPALWRMFVVPSWAPHLNEFYIGLLVSQCLLVGIWAGLGGLPMLTRWSLVSAVFLLGIASFAIDFWRDLNFRMQVLEFGLTGGMLVTTFAAMLLPLRGLLGWRLFFDASHYQNVRGRRGQVGFMDLAAMSLGIAVPLAIARLVEEFTPETKASGMFLVLVAFPATVGISACPIAYCLIRWRRLPLALYTSAGWVLLIGLVHCVLSLWISALSFFNNEHTWSTDFMEIGAFHAGIAVCTAATFTILRLSGLKLFALPLQSVEQASTLTQLS